jgi:sarcosine oxidase subunit beta
MSARADVAIVGGGVTGVAAAYELARAGARVRLFERHRLAAMGSGWTLGGVRQSGRHPAELPLARAAVARWAGLGQELGAETHYRRRGNLRLARTPDEAERIRALVASQRALGLDLEYLPDNASVRAVAPAIGAAVLAASFCPTDGHADPIRTVQAYAQAARRSGAVITEGIAVRAIRAERGRVVGLETPDGFVPADAVVVAAGVHAPELLATMGLDLPITAQVVSVVRTAPAPPVFDQVFGVANADCAGRQEAGGAFRFTTGVGPWRGDVARWSEAALKPPPEAVADLRRRVGALVPAMAQAPVEAVWGGLIDLTPDALPVIDALPQVRGLVVAAGFSGHGFGIAPLTGALVADLALGRVPALDLSAFRLARFAARTAPAAELTLHG